MKKRLVIQIDGGYLRAVAHGMNVKYSNDFIETIASGLIKHDEEDLLRIMYYDCPPYQGTRSKPISGQEQIFVGDPRWLDELASRQLFAVRRGTIKWRGWKLDQAEKLTGPPTDKDYKPDFQQKGVDLRIGVDMVTFAYERTADRVMLVAGDTDFIPAMKIARRRGMQVVAVDFPSLKISREFAQHVDLIRLCEASSRSAPSGGFLGRKS